MSVTRVSIPNALFILCTIAVLFFSVRVVGPERMRDWIETSGTLAPVVFVLVKASTIAIAPLSGGFLYPLGGTLFGFGKGVALVVLADAIGGTIAFWISRLFGRAAVERILGEEAGAMGRALDAMGTMHGFLVTRILFVMSQDLVSYAAGLTRLGFPSFLIIHVVVGVVPSVLMVWSGALIADDTSGIGLGAIIAGIGLLGGFSLAALMWYFRKTAASAGIQQEDQARNATGAPMPIREKSQ